MPPRSGATAGSSATSLPPIVPTTKRMILNRRLPRSDPKDDDFWHVLGGENDFFVCRLGQTPHEAKQRVQLLLAFHLPRVDVEFNLLDSEKMTIRQHIGKPDG